MTSYRCAAVLPLSGQFESPEYKSIMARDSSQWYLRCCVSISQANAVVIMIAERRQTLIGASCFMPELLVGDLLVHAQ